MATLKHKTWLLKGFYHSAPGVLEVTDQEVYFTLLDRGTFTKKQLNSLLEDEQACRKLEKEENILVFKWSLSNSKFRSPWYMMSGGGMISFQDKEYKLSFMQPQNTKFPYHKLGILRKEDLEDFSDGRAFGKKMKEFFTN